MKTKVKKSTRTKPATPAMPAAPPLDRSKLNTARMTYIVKNKRPIPYLADDNARPDGKELLTLQHTAERFGRDEDYWRDEWIATLGETLAEASQPSPLQIGSIVTNKQNGAALLVTHIEENVFIGLVIAADDSGPNIGQKYGWDRDEIGSIYSLNIFELADSLRSKAAAANFRTCADWIIGFEVGKPEPITCVDGERAPDGQMILTAEQCAQRFGGTAEEWRETWIRKFQMSKVIMDAIGK